MSPTTTSIEPSPASTIPDSLDRPSRWLRSGYVPFILGHVTAWIHVHADQPIDPSEGPTDPAEVGDLFRKEDTRTLLTQLSETFQPFLPITPVQWAMDLRQSPCPETFLRLWETVRSIFMYYTAGKKLPPGAATDYFWLILDFCNTGAADFVGTWRLRSLKPARVTRVIAELERWFQREGSL